MAIVGALILTSFWGVSFFFPMISSCHSVILSNSEATFRLLRYARNRDTLRYCDGEDAAGIPGDLEGAGAAGLVCTEIDIADQ